MVCPFTHSQLIVIVAGWNNIGAHAMAGKSIKNKSKYEALKRKGMSKTRAAKISNAGKSASRKGGRKGGRKSS